MRIEDIPVKKFTDPITAKEAFANSFAYSLPHLLPIIYATVRAESYKGEYSAWITIPLDIPLIKTLVTALMDKGFGVTSEEADNCTAKLIVSWKHVHEKDGK